METLHAHCPVCGEHPDELAEDRYSLRASQVLGPEGHLIQTIPDGQTLYICPCGWTGIREVGVVIETALAEDGGPLADEWRSRADRTVYHQRYSRWEGTPSEYRRDYRTGHAGRSAVSARVVPPRSPYEIGPAR